MKGRPIPEGLVPTSVLFVCFLLAGAAGCAAAAAAGEAGESSLSSYLQSYLSALSGGGAVSPSVWAVIWEMARWPFLVFLLGLTALGAVALPAVFCLRGFLLAYAIASFARVFGREGLLLAFGVFGVTAFVAIPALFALGAVAFPASLRMAAGLSGERPSSSGPGGRIMALVPCGVLTALAVFFQWAVMPQMLSIFSGMLTIT